MKTLNEDEIQSPMEVVGEDILEKVEVKAVIAEALLSSE